MSEILAELEQVKRELYDLIQVNNEVRFDRDKAKQEYKDLEQ